MELVSRLPDEKEFGSKGMPRRSGIVAHHQSKILMLSVAIFLALFYNVLPALEFQIKPHHQCSDNENQTFIYPGESISWYACGNLSNRTLECSTLKVPMDQFNATNSRNDTFSLPLIRIRGRNATRNVVFNPGGPGGSGVGAIYGIGDKLHALIGEGFHLLSFDPRGINGSRPAASCFPEGDQGRTLRQAHSLVHQGRKEEDMAEIVAWTANYVRACEETTGNHGKYISTPQTAADMNSILDAVGQDEMLYYGVSYGTLLGQTYAAMFPERSRRIIIDGVINAFQWYDQSLFSDSLIDNERIFDEFLYECVKSGPKNCTLAAVESNPQDLSNRFWDLIEALQDQPMNVYINNTNYGLITAETVLDTAVFEALYRPISWPGFADRLSQLILGNGTAFLGAYGLSEDSDMAAFDFVMSNDGLSGPTYWKQGRNEMIQALQPLWNESRFAHAHSRLYYPKQQWPLTRSHNFTFKDYGINGSSIQTLHPLLILSTTYNPVTPLVSAKSANLAFQGSQVIEIQGYGHSSLAEPSRCLVKRLRDYLYDGILPDGYSTCKVDQPYFPHIDDRDKVKPAAWHLEDDDDEKAFEAQAALAREWKWNHY